MERLPRLSAKIKKTWRILGPGLITGASDDDPSGIATYSQVGSGFGLATLWTALITFPLMAAVQEMCARIGMVTEEGLTATLRNSHHFTLRRRKTSTNRENKHYENNGSKVSKESPYEIPHKHSRIGRNHRRGITKRQTDACMRRCGLRKDPLCHGVSCPRSNAVQ